MIARKREVHYYYKHTQERLSFSGQALLPFRKI